MNFTADFRTHVIGRFVETYERGGTPNPCIDCNRRIKFSALLQRARELQCVRIATGHYARIEESGGRYLLKRGVDTRKDQSYVLYAMTQEQLAMTDFPLGGLRKEEVRAIAAAHGFINADKADSQDICFVPDGDYGAFLERWTGRRYAEGDILDEAGAVIGRHRGLPRYTIGQRRRLGISGGSDSRIPLYVKAKSVAANTVTLGPEASLYSKSLLACDVNLIACDRLDGPVRVTAKTRYTQTETPATARQRDDGLLAVDFDEPVRAVTPGQACVLYCGDLVLGGGTIV
jgi:tRNA-specific 2-thiouridylase